VKNIAILGSTGSIGASTLAIVRTHPGQFSVKVLAARRNAQKLFEQASEFRPDFVCLYEPEGAAELKRKLRPLGIKVMTGQEGLLAASRHRPVQEVVFALVGAVGLLPIFEAIRAGKAVAIANKEPLVVAGDLVIKESRKYKVPIFPIDSEHSALWQCLEGRSPESIKKLILTSSGGPFRTKKGTLGAIKPAQALKHPKWKMGPKITIDSATLMNKGLEVIEASHLFQMPAHKIEVLVHPEAIIHGMIEFVDGSHLAHLGITDMRLPIQYALSYPDRLMNHLPTLDFVHLHGLHFEKPDIRRFPCLELGYEASRVGRSMPAVLNAANEVAVERFLKYEIGFLGIPKLIEKVMKRHQVIQNPCLEDLLQVDEWARKEAEKL